MKKLILQVQISVDGFIAGPNDEMDWMVWNWDDKMKKHVTDLTDNIDTILLGRKMCDGFVSHWSSVAARPADPEQPFAKKMVDTPKVVFSNTLQKSAWANTTLANGDLTTEVRKLKSQNGKDMIVYGGANFNSSLIAADLIDEYNLFVNPATIGKGKSIFQGLQKKQSMRLKRSTAFECGIVLLQYEVRR